MKQLNVPPPDAIERIRFKSEQELFDELSSDKLIAPVAEKLRNSNAEHAHRRGLLANALRITDRIIPSLADHIELAQRITHLDRRDVETFVYNEPKLSASCACFENGSVFLLISSGLYTKLTERELLFVVGHELGHVVYDHYLMPARAILAQKGVCDAENALKLMAWSRRAEISADRAGLLCCQDFDAAAKAFVKLSSGLGEELADFDVMGYVAQITDLESVSRSVRAVDDLYSTHPFNPIRMVALYRLWHSATFCDLLGHAPSRLLEHVPARLSDQDVDARIHELLELMDPDFSTMGTRNVDECCIWGVFRVAASSGQIDQAKFQALSKSLKSRIASEAFAVIQKAAEPLKVIREKFERAVVGCRRLPPPQRHAIVQQVIAAIQVHVDVAADERGALQEICISLELNPGFADKVLTQYAQQTQSVDTIFAQMF